MNTSLSRIIVRPTTALRSSHNLTRYQISVNSPHTTPRRTFYEERATTQTRRQCLFRAPAERVSPLSMSRSLRRSLYKDRLASTSAATPQTSSIPPDVPEQPSLTWQQYFDLRRSRRRYNLSSSVVSAGASTYMGVFLLQTNALDFLATTFGLDPFISMGLTVTVAGGAGWLVGPIVGSTVFRLANRKVIPEMASVSHARPNKNL